VTSPLGKGIDYRLWRKSLRQVRIHYFFVGSAIDRKVDNERRPSVAILAPPLREVLMARRSFLRQMMALPVLGLTTWGQESERKTLNVMMKSAWGSDDPTKAAFPFLHGLALSEAGHSVQIFLLGEAVSLMRKSVAGAVVPVGWPPLEETMTKVAARHVQIYACGACCRARSVVQTDLDQWGAKFGNPTIFVSLVEWADRVITE
jgi:predicted peroxiredoxin